MENVTKGRVLLISNLFSMGVKYGGVCKELAVHLSKRGWQVTTTSSVRNRYFRPIDMLVTLSLTHHRYDVAQIDVFSGPAFRWAEVAAKGLHRLGKPFILTLHGGNLPEFGTRNRNRVRTLLEVATAVTTPSRYLLESMSVYRTDIRLIPNPIDIEAYSFRARDIPAPRLLYLRALQKMYNPSMAVDALNELRQQFPQVQLTMVGPDKDHTLEQLHEVIQRIGADSAVTLTGAIPKVDVPNVMNQADIFLNTTNIDNTPISVIEAMACGLCIVSTDVGGIPYLLEDEHDALLVPPNDAHAMAVAVKRILTERGLAEHLSRNARAKAEQFDWAIVLPQWEHLLTEVAQHNKASTLF